MIPRVYSENRDEKVVRFALQQDENVVALVVVDENGKRIEGGNILEIVPAERGYLTIQRCPYPTRESGLLFDKNTIRLVHVE